MSICMHAVFSGVEDRAQQAGLSEGNVKTRADVTVDGTVGQSLTATSTSDWATQQQQAAVTTTMTTTTTTMNRVWRQQSAYSSAESSVTGGSAASTDCRSAARQLYHHQQQQQVNDCVFVNHPPSLRTDCFTTRHAPCVISPRYIRHSL